MATQGYEFTGKSVEEATEEGLIQLNTTQEQVEVEILSRGSRGIFGIGSEMARVRIKPLKAPNLETSTQTNQQEIESPETTARTEDVEQPAKAARRSAAAQDSSTSAVESVDSDPAEEAATTPRAIAKDAKERKTQRTPSVKSSVAKTSKTGEQPSDQELATIASELLARVVELMQFVDTTVTAQWQEPEDEHDGRYLILNIQGDEEELSTLIGRRSETLEALQYLLRLMINQRTRQWHNLVVDVNNYKERRAEQLTQLALRMAGQVIDSQRAISLEPMPANERRIVHLALRDHQGVFTESSGAGERRKVHIVPDS